MQSLNKPAFTVKVGPHNEAEPNSAEKRYYLMIILYILLDVGHSKLNCNWFNKSVKLSRPNKKHLCVNTQLTKVKKGCMKKKFKGMILSFIYRSDSHFLLLLWHTLSTGTAVPTPRMQFHVISRKVETQC